MNDSNHEIVLRFEAKTWEVGEKKFASIRSLKTTLLKIMLLTCYGQNLNFVFKQFRMLYGMGANTYTFMSQTHKFSCGFEIRACWDSDTNGDVFFFHYWSWKRNK